MVGRSTTWEPGGVDDVRVADSGDLEWALEWHLEADGGLRGVLRAHNVSSERVRLGGKPNLTPLSADGAPLGAETVLTLEARIPGHVDLDPGQPACTDVGWAGWDGPNPSDQVRVQTAGGDRAIVQVSGPVRPAATGPATNLWSGWFRHC